jgi:hypothetical protein
MNHIAPKNMIQITNAVLKKLYIKLIRLKNKLRVVIKNKTGYIKHKSILMSYLYTVQYHSHTAYNDHTIDVIKSGRHRTDVDLRLYRSISKYPRKKMQATMSILPGCHTNHSIGFLFYFPTYFHNRNRL